MKSAIAASVSASKTGDGVSATGTITGGTGGRLPDEPLLARSPEPSPLPPALQPDSSAAKATDPPHLDAA
jgi:hypothetical protein